MSGPAGFLEFFILEASDYVEQLDRLLLDGGASGPDTGALQRVARALRGTATMAKLPSFADVAAALERVGRALQEGTVRWDPALGGALVGAIDDLRILLRGARTWSAEEEHRARSRAADLSRYAPIGSAGASGTPGMSAGRDLGPAATSAFLSTEAANIAAGVELLTAHGGDAVTAANVLRRVRALRGVAGVSEIGPLADVLEATEESGRSLETGESMTPDVRALLEAAAAHLRTLSAELRTGGDVNAPSSTRDAFEAARDALGTRAAERERVVPIEELFYPEDPGVVEAAAAPPTSASERFRLELVSLGEHLRQVVASARRATEAASVARSRREITRAMRALEAAAASFGHREIADAIADRARETEGLGGANLAVLDQLAVQLSRPDLSVEELRAALVPAPPPPPPRPMPREPVNAASLIDSTLFALDELEPAAFADRVAIPEDTVVPIESLLYRGRAALERAVEIRDALRSSGSYDDREALDELFDLLDLARAE
ncbi:MAG TPA: Hpt domain-containing protein [Gemmatimonadaceae bacterium]|jgi:chemotaxis protein histidine kinase CheA|nr:Hpt domain-containing protein [Gemmatimonadaceae bacterium]